MEQGVVGPPLRRLYDSGEAETPLHDPPDMSLLREAGQGLPIFQEESHREESQGVPSELRRQGGVAYALKRCIPCLLSDHGPKDFDAEDILEDDQTGLCECPCQHLHTPQANIIDLPKLSREVS